MFDISLMEMLIVAIAALVVIGPERLPGVARQAGQWLTRMRRYVEDIKSDFSQQMDLAELKNIKSEMEDSARSLQSGLQDTMNAARSSFDTLQSSFDTRSTNYIPEGQDGAQAGASAALPAPGGADDGSLSSSAGGDDWSGHVSCGGEQPDEDGGVLIAQQGHERLPPTDWDKVYEDRRMRQRLKDRRIERELERGFKRPRFRVER